MDIIFGPILQKLPPLSQALLCMAGKLTVWSFYLTLKVHIENRFHTVTITSSMISLSIPLSPSRLRRFSSLSPPSSTFNPPPFTLLPQLFTLLHPFYLCPPLITLIFLVISLSLMIIEEKKLWRNMNSFRVILTELFEPHTKYVRRKLISFLMICIIAMNSCYRYKIQPIDNKSFWST